MHGMAPSILFPVWSLVHGNPGRSLLAKCRRCLLRWFSCTPATVHIYASVTLFAFSSSDIDAIRRMRLVPGFSFGAFALPWMSRPSMVAGVDTVRLEPCAVGLQHRVSKLLQARTVCSTEWPPSAASHPSHIPGDGLYLAPQSLNQSCVGECVEGSTQRRARL